VVLRRSYQAGIGLPLLAVLAASACQPVDTALGRDHSAKPDVCAVVAPAGMHPQDLRAAIATVVDRTAHARGRLRLLIASGPSAAAFDWARFGAGANSGDFASEAANAFGRDQDARRWKGVALATIEQQLAETTYFPGLDLVGAAVQCVAGFEKSGRARVLAIVSTGLHQTSEVNVSHTPDAADDVVARVEATLGERVSLELYGIGRVDERALDGQVPSRPVMERVLASWSAGCARLADRCTWPAEVSGS
jgi:hypothetical protein